MLGTLSRASTSNSITGVSIDISNIQTAYFPQQNIKQAIKYDEYNYENKIKGQSRIIIGNTNRKDWILWNVIVFFNKLITLIIKREQNYIQNIIVLNLHNNLKKFLMRAFAKLINRAEIAKRSIGKIKFCFSI